MATQTKSTTAAMQEIAAPSSHVAGHQKVRRQRAVRVWQQIFEVRLTKEGIAELRVHMAI